MLLWHATPRRNRPSISTYGLLTRMAKGKRKAVWFHGPRDTPWACGHCVLRHGGRIEDVIVLLVEVPEEIVKRHGGCRDLWYVTENVPEEWIVGALEFEAVFKSEVDDNAE